MLFIWLGNRKNWPLIIWFLLSIGMIIVPNFFWINDFINHPQHEEFECYNRISDTIKKQEYASNKSWYQIFFIIDFFWAFLLLTIIGKFINDYSLDENGETKEDKTSIWDLFRFKSLNKTLKVYMIIAVISYLTDVIEGLQYFTFQDVYLECIVNCKKAFYFACFLFFIYHLFKVHIYPNIRSIIRFILTSLLSIVCILVIYILLIFVPQGGTIVVELFYSPLNIILFFFLLMFLAILLSHYPIYFDIWAYDKRKTIKLLMFKNKSLFGFGTIYYDTSKATNSSYSDAAAKGLRRSLGIFLYVAVFTIIYSVIARYYEININPLTSVLFVMAIALFIYYLEGQTYQIWMEKLTKPTIPWQKLEEYLGYVVNYVKWFPWYFFGTIVLTFITAWIVHKYGWSKESVISFLITLGTQTFLYVMFKISRSFLKYVFYNDTLYSKRPAVYNSLLRKRFNRFFSENTEKKPYSFLSFLAYLSDNVTYTIVMQVTGIVAFAIVIVANLSVKVATSLNPIIIILFYLILFYSFIVILFKHVLFYIRKSAKLKHSNKFRFGIPVIILLVIGITQYLANKPNDLHVLQKVTRKSQFKAENYFETKIDDSASNQNYFFVGSYGGGLKANLWNLLIFNELEKKSQKQFFNNTLVLSGVSGGAVGIGNYVSLLRNFSGKKEVIDNLIIKIGESNVLSNEITLLLGKDWLREYIPRDWFQGRDRSYHSMRIHAKNTGMIKSTEKDYGYDESYEDYWREVYDLRKQKFPILIMNSTQVGGKHGVASTVEFPVETFDRAVQMNQFKSPDSTLKFYDAVSTTNRFPFLSPTAKIEGKGSYLDGGYFENSGLLSAYQVYEYLEDNHDLERPKICPIFINIINSKDFYIRRILDKAGIKSSYKEDPSEYQSIIETVTSTEKMPYHIINKIESDTRLTFIPVMMPHKINYSDVKRLLRGKVEDPFKLMELIETNNEAIDNALSEFKDYKLQDWGVVEPPLARMLSKPAVLYQKAMVKKHPDVVRQIEDISKIAKRE